MSQSFADLGVSHQVASALAKRGINEPFPVQRLVIEDVLAGEDVLVQSPTGSGKTLAFGVPMVDTIDSNSTARPAALILAPTRELASQIVDEMLSIAHARALSVAAVYGGVGFGPQIKRARKAHIIVATPGRLEDLIQRGDIRLDKVEILVLDEADRMLDMGFKPAVDRIVGRIPTNRQTLLFSATLQGATGKMASDFTRNPKRHVHEHEHTESAAISHRFVDVESQSAKLNTLVTELRGMEAGRTLVFVRTKRGADRLVKRLATKNVRAVAMHGDKSQSQRQRALASFEKGDVDTLVATDVAARGIDVADITHVYNFDIPEDGDTYRHRVGRTGRAGREGAGVSFILADQSREMRLMAGELGLSSEFNSRPGHRQETPRSERESSGQHSSSRRGQHSSRSGQGHGRPRANNQRRKKSDRS